MSFRGEAGGNNLSYDRLTLSDLLLAVEKGVLDPPTPGARQTRKRNAAQRVKQASLMAPLLAAQGCLTLGQDDLALDSGAGAGGSQGPDGAAPRPTGLAAQDDEHFQAQPDGELYIAAPDLLANDLHEENEVLQLVRVYDAVNGTVRLEGDIVIFTPDPGYHGPASFSYQVRDGDGNLSEAVVEIHVGESEPAHEHEGDGDPGHGGGGHPHPDDPSKAAEHMAFLDLAPVDEATHIAVKDGSWFDPTTWAGGEIPGEGAKVLIPKGVSVRYDGESADSLFTVRVDGMLEFATDVNTFMEVDTLLVAPTGHMTIGAIDNPVDPDVETVIQIADNGPIDTAWDPMLLSRGIISHGTIEVHGAEKDTFLKVAADPMAGDTSITLESAPEGWEVGDKLVLTGTHLTNAPPADSSGHRDISTQDEELTITAIVGNVIHFDKALEFDHDTPRPDLKAYVSNFSRNVRIETENADSIPVHQRGHVMFMHSDNVDVRYAEFHELGRTDKSERAFDVADITTVEADSNVKGRYALHIHRAGVGDQDDPSMLVGNAIWGSPGWGVVHHDSNAIVADNAAYDIFGAAFVAETGNETGRWVHNIAIKSIGVGGGPKSHTDVQAFDLGRTGAGFWFQGRLVDAVDNVAASVPGGQGFVYMSRGGSSTIDVIPDNANQSESLRYLDDVAINKPALSQFVGNEAFAVGSGLSVIKPNPTQGHDVRSVIKDFTAWEVATGVHLQYTSHYTLIDLDVVATDQSQGGGNPDHAIFLDKNTFDVVLNRVNIDGFDTGLKLAKSVIHIDKVPGIFDYVFIDVNFENTTERYQNLDSEDKILTGADLIGGDNPFNVRLEFDSSLSEFALAPKNDSVDPLILSGVKRDSIGEIEISPDWDPAAYKWSSLRGAVEQEGYWTLPDGRQVTVFDQYFADRATGLLNKVAIPVTFNQTKLNDSDEFTRVTPEYHGVFDTTNEAPVARQDFAFVEENGSVIIDVLANDYDPEGDALSIDGFIDATHGRLIDNEDGTLTYIPDPNFVGTDAFSYWVEDTNGNFSMGQVQVTVEI